MLKRKKCEFHPPTISFETLKLNQKNRLIEDKNDIEKKKCIDLCAAPGGKSFQLLSRKVNLDLNDKNKSRIVQAIWDSNYELQRISIKVNLFYCCII